jgi:serine kinase of HPr protein (carbohydrate metabolism regulator)
MHATALVVGDRGILIRGASGSGKTALALALAARAGASGRFAALVADDQVLLEARRGRLVCLAPATIAGLVEVRGRSPQAVAFEPVAIVDLIVSLVEPADAPRYREERLEAILGIGTPSLVLAGRAAEIAVMAVSSWLGLRPFIA